MIGVLLFAGASLAQTSTSTSLTVNGKPVAMAKQDALLMEQLGQGRADNSALRAAVREELIRRELLAQEARAAGIDKQALAQAQVELAAESALGKLYLQQWLGKNPISDQAILAEYESWKTRMGPRELRVRQILVATEDEAKAVLKRLAANEKFESLAATLSRDASSRAEGGLLAWVPLGALNKPIAEAVGRLNKNELAANPVQTGFGWHVLRLEDVRAFSPPPVAQLQTQIRQSLEQQAIEAHMTQLRQKAKVD